MAGEIEPKTGLGGLEMKDRIECKVIRILSDRELVLDAGSDRGVEMGMVFNIQGVLDIQDPVSKAPIETLTFTKLSVRVSHLGSKVSVARTFRQGFHKDKSLGLEELTQDMLVERIESTSFERNFNWERKINIGDRAIQISPRGPRA